MRHFLRTMPLIVALSLLLSAVPAAAQDCLRYDRYLRWLGELDPSWATAVSLEGSRAVTISPAALDVIELSPTGIPSRRGTLDLEGALDVVLAGDLAFVGLSNDVAAGGQLRVIDVSDPEELLPATAVALPQPVRCVALIDDHVVAGTGLATPLAGALHVLDPTSIWGDPEVGMVSVPDAVQDVAVTGDLAFLAVRDTGLLVVDLAVPSAPIVSGAGDPCPAHRVAASNDLALLVTTEPALRIYGVADPPNPTLLATMPLSGAVGGMAVAGSWVILAGDPGGLLVVDVSVPTQPLVIGGRGIDPLQAVAVHGDRVVTLTEDGGVQVLALGSGDLPDLPGALAWDGCDALDLAVVGDRAYLADGDHGLRILDVADPLAPAFISLTPTAQRAFGVSVVGSRAYVVDMWPSTFSVFDVSDPGAVSLLGQRSLPDNSATEVTVAGNHAYVAGYCSGGISCDVPILDITAPGDIQQVGVLAMSGNAQEIVVVADRAVVAANNTSFGLQIYDVADPGNAYRLGQLEVGLYGKAVAVNGNVAYFVDASWGLFTIDITDPTMPFLMTRLELPGSPYGIALADGLAYLATREAGCQVVDVSDPAHPVILGGVDTPGDALCLASGDDAVFIGDNGHGLAVTWPQCQATPVVDDIDEIVPPSTVTAFPNPFNPRVTVSYVLSTAGPARLSVHDLAGRELAVLADGHRAAGRHAITWDGRDGRGQALPSGTYLLALTSAGKTERQKITLLR